MLWCVEIVSKFWNIIIVMHFNIKEMRKPDTMSPMKNPKRPFYDFEIKIMMYLDYSIWKFPFPTLGEGGKGRRKLSHCIDKPKFLPFINLSLLSSVVARSVTKRKVEGSNPAWAKLFFLDFYILFFSFLYIILHLILLLWHDES